MSCQKNSKLIKVEGSVFFFSSENGIKTCLERRAPPVPSAPKAAPASVLLCPCILITTLLIFMRLGTQGGLQSVILSLSLSSPPNLSRLSRWVFYFFFFSLPLPNSWRAADSRVRAAPKARSVRGAAAWGHSLCWLLAGLGTRVGVGLPLPRSAAPAAAGKTAPNGGTMLAPEGELTHGRSVFTYTHTTPGSSVTSQCWGDVVGPPRGGWGRAE